MNPKTNCSLCHLCCPCTNLLPCFYFYPPIRTDTDRQGNRVSSSSLNSGKPTTAGNYLGAPNAQSTLKHQMSDSDLVIGGQGQGLVHSQGQFHSQGQMPGSKVMQGRKQPPPVPVKTYTLKRESEPDEMKLQSYEGSHLR